MLPSDAAERKDIPIYSGVLMYFPNAIAEVAKISKQGNDQHNPGQPLHWAKHKSQDQLDCVARHLMEAGSIDTKGQRHSANLAWRALANLEIEILAERAGMTVEGYNRYLREHAQEAKPCSPSTTPAPTGAPALPETGQIQKTAQSLIDDAREWRRRFGSE